MISPQLACFRISIYFSATITTTNNWKGYSYNDFCFIQHVLWSDWLSRPWPLLFPRTIDFLLFATQSYKQGSSWWFRSGGNSRWSYVQNVTLLTNSLMFALSSWLQFYGKCEPGNALSEPVPAETLPRGDEPPAAASVNQFPHLYDVINVQARNGIDARLGK